MKNPFKLSSSQRGSAFVTVMGFCIILLMLVASVLQYSTSERKLNNRSKLHLEARLGAEAISEYGIAQVKHILETDRSFANSTWSNTVETLFTPTGTFHSAIEMPDDPFWQGSHIVPSTGAAAQAPSMQVGKILDPDGGNLYYIDPTNPDNASDPLKGKRVFRYTLDILSRATASDPFAGGTVTSFMQQTFVIRAAPLFSNAVYYNMDFELQPGPNMTITGATHTNGRMFVRSASASPTYIRFAGPVTAVKGLWLNFARETADTNANTGTPYFQNYNEQGGLQDNVVNNASSPGPIQILPAGATSDTQYVSMKLSANTTGFSPNLTTTTNGGWVESTWTQTPGTETWRQHVGESGSTRTDNAAGAKEQYANWIQQKLKGNLLTHVNGIPPVTLQGIPDYTYVYGSAYPDPAKANGGLSSIGTGDLTSDTETDSAAYSYKPGDNDNTDSSFTSSFQNQNGAHALIEPPRSESAASYYEPTERIKYSRNAGLYIIANTTGAARYGHKPDGTRVKVGKYSYRAFMNDSSVSPQIIKEVLLPGQDTYGEGNLRPNPYKTAAYYWHKDARPVVTLFNHYYSPDTATNNRFTEKFPALSADGTPSLPTNMRRMTDLRRFSVYEPPQGTSNATGRSNNTTEGALGGTYDPKNLFMIDLDVTELKKAVKAINLANPPTTGTASTVTTYGGFYDTMPPKAELATTGSTSAKATLTNFIYNNSATTISPPIGVDASKALNNHILLIPEEVNSSYDYTNSSNVASPPSMTKAYTAPSASGPSNWNGAVYVESIAAEMFDTTGTTAAIRHLRTRKLRNSGVRLINARGKVPSIDDDTVPGAQGFSLITNDAVYVLGDFNADGLDTTPSVSGFTPAHVKLLPDVPGASSGQFPEGMSGTDVASSTELPASIVADAITLLSQPSYTSDTVQDKGWNDALSGYRYTSSNWVTGWATTSASASSRIDGIGSPSVSLYRLPYDSSSGTLATASDAKLAPQFTEYATAMLMGLVPTGKGNIRQTSGSFNNFPRFLDGWSGSITVRIRGAFVALFECRVATEPWNLHVYGAPGRDWGFNLLFAEGRMPPLTPKVLNFRRSGAVDKTKAEYNAKLNSWGYTPLP